MRYLKFDSNVGGHRLPRFLTQNFESTPLLAPSKENDTTSLFGGWFFWHHFANQQNHGPLRQTYRAGDWKSSHSIVNPQHFVEPRLKVSRLEVRESTQRPLTPKRSICACAKSSQGRFSSCAKFSANRITLTRLKCENKWSSTSRRKLRAFLIKHSFAASLYEQILTIVIPNLHRILMMKELQQRLNETDEEFVERVLAEALAYSEGLLALLACKTHSTR